MTTRELPPVPTAAPVVARRPVVTVRVGAMAPNSKLADENIQKMINQLEPEIRKNEQADKRFEHLKAICYKSQNLNGTTYAVKVNVGGKDHIHVQFHQPLPSQDTRLTLLGVQLNKTLSAPLRITGRV